ncbi:putative reverse transcriptase-rnase h-integrase [Lyophyllum shimeji]|uniref:Reverse transcriptase-rnase h-integrase n=1 Tax=Lyophyllum shimeji TaxID=47721 RepID=A0A9P3Q339_LYOSH|nr:putative reverse transcriptase-rnase h-integrase [Lyophyllum shimeji]
MLDELFALDEWGTWKDFVKEIKDAFSAADAAGDARAKLKVLKQTGTANEYIAEFKPKLVEKVLGVEKPLTTIKRDPNVMDVDRLSLEEREEHFKKGLCFECHKPGHRAADHKKGTVPEQKKYDFTSRKKAPRTGKETHLCIKAMIEALDEKEKEECMKKLEDEGF